jgi:hypothetical protein
LASLTALSHLFERKARVLEIGSNRAGRLVLFILEYGKRFMSVFEQQGGLDSVVLEYVTLFPWNFRTRSRLHRANCKSNAESHASSFTKRLRKLPFIAKFK